MFPKFTVLAACLASLTASPAGIGVERVAKGFERPVWAGVPKGITGKIWVMEQAGQVWIVDEKTGAREKEPFLDIRQDVSRKGNEEGLLGLAFAPDFGKSGRFYVNYTDKEKQTRIVRFTSADRKTTHASDGEILLKYPSEFENHNGGWLDFGPDGMLYIGNGDGGAGNDPNKRGQALDTLLGKILR
ncbi:MAG TPA: PQQ-dependent sugar dehydrogenase, partial [Luteolibacter sp.]